MEAVGGIALNLHLMKRVHLGSLKKEDEQDTTNKINEANTLFMAETELDPAGLW